MTPRTAKGFERKLKCLQAHISRTGRTLVDSGWTRPAVVKMLNSLVRTSVPTKAGAPSKSAKAISDFLAAKPLADLPEFGTDPPDFSTEPFPEFDRKELDKMAAEMDERAAKLAGLKARLHAEGLHDLADSLL